LSVYPNPFVLSEAGTKSTVRIKLELSKVGEIDLSIYNMKGQKVKQLIEGKSSKGIFTANWDLKDKNGKKVSTGIYFVKLSQNKKLTRVSKLTVIK
jgi:flagellar hook assembly protein FlgD